MSTEAAITNGEEIDEETQYELKGIVKELTIDGTDNLGTHTSWRRHGRIIK